MSKLPRLTAARTEELALLLSGRGGQTENFPHFEMHIGIPIYIYKTSPSRMTDIKTTSLLTEHFGYPPIALVDDIINAVNEIMYKCTKAIEIYLTERQSKLRQQAGDQDIVMGEEGNEGSEIEVGTAKLETLLESCIDKNFDKFELYAFRNILTIPPDLVQDGWMRLSHHSDLVKVDQCEKQCIKNNETIARLRTEISTQLKMRSLLNSQKAKAAKLIGHLIKVRNQLCFISEAEESHPQLAPLNENLYFLVSKSNELYRTYEKIRDRFAMPVAEGGISDIDTLGSSRDKYIDAKSAKLLSILGVEESKDEQELVPIPDGEKIDFDALFTG